jgi:hypothetical protein
MSFARGLLLICAGGVALLAGLPSALASDPGDCGSGFVLLSMEQAGTYRGAQAPYCCMGSGTLAVCQGYDNICAYDTKATCESYTGRRYSGNAVSTCECCVPCGGQYTDACKFLGNVACWTWFFCSWHGDEEFGWCERGGNGGNSPWPSWQCGNNVPVP